MFLRDYLRSNEIPNAFEDWLNSGFITGVSYDGQVIVGQGAGPLGFQGYVVVLGS
ncbi:MAG TPA: hypothetical protein VEK15_24655 [Vicinamibacteria bacterium]|nr:hypothetical protein [Vicinamibacteria bacterium]